MEALVVNKFFDLLSKALSSEHPGSFSFSENLRQALSSTVPKPAPDARPHDISYLVYRLKENAFGMPDPIDGKVRNTPETLIPFACDLLKDRWKAIKDTREDYTRRSVAENKPSLIFVKQLVNFFWSSLECEPRLESSMRRWMHPFSIGNNKIKPNIYALLIPTLTQTIDLVTTDTIIKSDLHGLVLSESETSLLSLKNSDDWFKRGKGFFNLDQGAPQLFTELEKRRIKEKPRDFWPYAMLYTDYIATKSYLGPSLALTTKKTILGMLDRAAAIKADPNLSFDAFKQKYSIENKSLAPQDIEYLRAFHVAEGPKPSPNEALSDNALRFIALKSRQENIATITAEMLVYCSVLEDENPDQHQCLMNQVLLEEKKQPKTFESLLKYVPNGIDCSEVLLLTTLSRLFKPLRPEASAKRPIEPVAPSTGAPSAISNFFSFFSSSPHEPRSIADKMAYSPDDKKAYASDSTSHH